MGTAKTVRGPLPVSRDGVAANRTRCTCPPHDLLGASRGSSDFRRQLPHQQGRNYSSAPYVVIADANDLSPRQRSRMSLKLLIATFFGWRSRMKSTVRVAFPATPI